MPAEPDLNPPRRRRRRIRPPSGRRPSRLAVIGVPCLIALALVAALPGPIFRADLLQALANPNLALLLLLAGILLSYLECNRPGAVLPAALATLFSTLALFSLSRLPLNPATLVAVPIALALLAAEIVFASRYILAAIATAVLAWGLARLVHNPAGPSTQHLPVHPAVALVTAFLFVAATLPLARIALRARSNKRIQAVTARSASTAAGRVDL